MFNRSTDPLYITLQFTVDSAKELQDILKPIADVYDNQDLNIIVKSLGMIQSFPDLIQEIEAQDMLDEMSEDGGYRYEPFPEFEPMPTWRMN